MGNFNTFLGYEVISPTANFNYSTSYMFSYGPFSHTGLKADFNLTEDLTAMVGVFNATDFTDYSPFDTYTLGAQLGYKGLYLNFLYGDQDGELDEATVVTDDISNGKTFQVDFTGGWDLSESVYVGFNATVNKTERGEVFDGTAFQEMEGDAYGFMGSAMYFQVDLSDALAVGTRVEYFKEFEGGVGAIGVYDEEGDAEIIDVTLTGQYKLGGLTLIPEFRIDQASNDGVFLDRGLVSSKNLSSFILAAVYSF